jgi:hypothetical protein
LRGISGGTDRGARARRDGDRTFVEGVPGLALRTASEPSRRLEAARITEEDGARFCHESMFVAEVC